LSERADPDDGRQVFRSPAARAIWWLWVLFALANLIDLAVQGRDHLSLIAACTLLLITGIMYATAQRPRIIADADGVTVVNPIREHRVGWAAVVGFDATELMRMRCVWLTEDGSESKMRGIYAWAAHSSRRKQVAAEMRKQRQARGRGARPSFGGYGAPAREEAPPPAPLGLDVEVVMASLGGLAERAKLDAPESLPRPPVSAWSWSAIAAIVAPALLLAIVALV
jgi:hypothetical protein